MPAFDSLLPPEDNSDPYVADWNSVETSSHRFYWVKVCLIIAYTSVAVLTLFNNVTVIIVLLLHKAMGNITNIFIFVLAISDIIMCTFYSPIQAYYEIMENVSFSTEMCRFIFGTCGLPMYVSSQIILLIAIDRYRMIVLPLKPRISAKCAIGLIISVILFSVINLIPIFVFTKSAKPAGLNIKNSYCVETWPGNKVRMIYSWIIACFLFFLPLLCTALLYFGIFWSLRQRAKTEVVSKSKHAAERKNRTNCILISIVVCFAVCWSPWIIYSQYLEYTMSSRNKGSAKGISAGNSPKSASLMGGSSVNRLLQQPVSNISGGYNDDDINKLIHMYNLTSSDFGLSETDHTKVIDMILKLFALCSGFINPFLYGWMNDSIRKKMVSLYQKLCPKCQCCKSNNKSRNQRNNNDLGNGNNEFLMANPLLPKLSPTSASNNNNTTQKDVLTLNETVNHTILLHDNNNSIKT